MSQNRRVPRRTRADAVHAGIRGGLQAIPIVGGLAAEVFQALIAPPLERRRDEWMAQIAQDLEDITTRGGPSAAALLQDESFVTMFVQATQIAVRNHHKEKTEALRAAVSNSATAPDLRDDLHLSFIRYVDELSPSHIILLRVLLQRHPEVSSAKSYEDLYNACVGLLPFSPSRDVFKMLVLDLQTRGLIRISGDIDDFDDIYHADAIITEETRDDLPRLLVTEVGRAFIEFTSRPPGA